MVEVLLSTLDKPDMYTVVCVHQGYDYVTGCLLTRRGSKTVGYAPDG